MNKIKLYDIPKNKIKYVEGIGLVLDDEDIDKYECYVELIHVSNSGKYGVVSGIKDKILYIYNYIMSRSIKKHVLRKVIIDDSYKLRIGDKWW